MVSILVRPMFLNRYMYPACGLLFLGISIAVCKNKYKNILRNLLIGLIILNIPFSYGAEYSAEYKNGTERFKTFAKENIDSQAKISTDIFGLYLTILPYYLPNNQITFLNIEDTSEKYIITKKTEKELQRLIPDVNIDFVYEGDIDNTYKLKVYYIN